METKTVENKFKPFDETFNLCAFSLNIGLMYPNKCNVRKRWLLLLFIIGLNSFYLYWLVVYFFKCLYRQDIHNFTRHVTVIIITVLFIYKSFYAIYKTNEFSQLLLEITEDLLRGNILDKHYQEIYHHYIKSAKVGQICWFIVPLLLGTQFTVTSAVYMIYEYIKTGKWNKYMVHEMELHLLKEKQYDTPYFEIIFAINCLHALILFPNFSGFDGSFCIATTHMCLKLEVLAYSVKRAFEDAKDRTELRKIIKGTIDEHKAALNFYNIVQKVYGDWLFVVFLMTSLLISFNVYQIYLVKRVDPKYTVFLISAVLQIYVPCYYASNLIKVNEDLRMKLYHARWERWLDPVVTKHIIFMIIRSQKSLLLTGRGIVIYDMKLFVSIMQTSYSFFTLISRK